MLLIKLHKRYYPAAQSWDELTARQIARVLEVMKPGADKNTVILALFHIITGVTWLKLWYAGAEDVGEKLYITDFLFGKNDMCKNVVPLFRGKYGPDGGFNNIRVAEFIFSEFYYRQYITETNAADKANHLNSLVAILYRDVKPGYDFRKNSDGDPREPFNENLIPHNARRVARWPDRIKSVIVHWYQGCRNNLQKDFPELFEHSDGGDDQSKYGMWDMVYNIADKGVFGEFEKVETQYLKTLLMAVTKMMIDAAAAAKNQNQKTS